MNLTYTNDLEYINKIEKFYINSFPKEERFSFDILKECSNEDNSDLYVILDNNIFIGMCFLVNCDNAYYLMYLAVEPNLRNKGYGSKILNDLKCKYKTIFLSVDYNEDIVSIKRKKFYLKNGFYKTNKIYEDTGVLYEVLCTNQEYEITENNMRKRYSNMTNNSSIYKKISDTFNTNKIIFINQKQVK